MFTFDLKATLELKKITNTFRCPSRNTYIKGLLQVKEKLWLHPEVTMTGPDDRPKWSRIKVKNEYQKWTDRRRQNNTTDF